MKNIRIKNKMKKIIDWWENPIKLTEKESKILSICEHILLMPDVEIWPKDFGFLIRSKKIGYFLHIGYNGLAYTNHDFAHSKPYREKFLNLLKDTILAKSTSEVDGILSHMDRNEDKLLDKMLLTLQTYINEN
tara:strand:- start:5603 stop:6001 length:399 start_codon:yes stop_codon:yes gene_type:complete